MADVYVAFVRDDQSYAEALAVALQGSGFTVSRSPSVVEAIDECGAIVVLWTAAAARSKLFIDAADRAFRSGKMVLARMGPEPLPPMFAGTEAHSLARWSGDPESPEIDAVVFHVDRLVNRGRPRGQPEAPPETAQRGVVHRFPAGGGGGGAARAARPMEAPPQPRPAAPPYQAPPDPLAEEAAYWRRIQHSTDPADFYAYLERYGRNGTFAELAEARMRALSPRQPQRPAPQPMPPPQPQPMHPQQYGQQQPPVQRGGFTMNPPMPRPSAAPAPPRMDPYPAAQGGRADPGAPPKSGGGGLRGLAFLLFLAIIGGGGYYIYRQLEGPEIAAPADTAENWTPPAGSPAEPELTGGADSATTQPASVRQTSATPAERRPAPAARTQPDVEPEGPPPPPVLRTIPAVPYPTPSVPDASVDLQRDVGPATSTVSAQIGPPQTAAATTPSAPRQVRPRWAERPSARDLQSAYPAAAQRREVQGRVTLDCLIGTDLAIRCRTLSETPTGYGFGAAALRVAQQFRAAPTLEDGRPAAGERAQVTLVFKP